VRERLRHLPASLIASAVLLGVAVPVAWLFSGPAAAVGVTAGVALVAFSYLVSGLVVAWADLVARHLMLPVVLLTYALKFVLFGVVLYRVREVGWAGLYAMGIAAIVATFVWTGAHLYWIMNAKIPYVEIE
jgi:hypothetical protein